MIDLLVNKAVNDFRGIACMTTSAFILGRFFSMEIYRYNDDITNNPQLYKNHLKAKALNWYKRNLMFNKITRAFFGVIFPENCLPAIFVGFYFSGIQRNVFMNLFNWIRYTSYCFTARLFAYKLCTYLFNDPACNRQKKYYHIILGAVYDPEFKKRSINSYAIHSALTIIPFMTTTFCSGQASTKAIGGRKIHFHRSSPPPSHSR